MPECTRFVNLKNKLYKKIEHRLRKPVHLYAKLVLTTRFNDVRFKSQGANEQNVLQIDILFCIL